jgi:hypothetical protein
MLGKKDEITSIGKGTIGCGFIDPSGSTTCNIKKVRGISARCEYPRKLDHIKMDETSQHDPSNN